MSLLLRVSSGFSLYEWSRETKRKFGRYNTSSIVCIVIMVILKGVYTQYQFGRYSIRVYIKGRKRVYTQYQFCGPGTHWDRRGFLRLKD